ncbi:MAG TPA: aromatic amino acid hydroxylase [Bdellovibrionota bacterium]|nr:aromatic amino acid hydroxylase [Bdellovibrionota bacterium]
MSPRGAAANEVPEYLRPYVVEQDASLYTAIDHASWRFILKISQAFFAEHAHEKYLSGLRETGISTERIPLISEMDGALRKFGWRAVAVSGFIPPAVFMEFLSLGILPIACDMRKLENLAYTPAPDIVHEAAGHAPMIADPEYERYLRNYGEISRRAIYSSQDMDVYHAIRNLSEVKENPRSSPTEIAAAQKRLDETVASVTFASEAALLARMNWWTIEYGLVGSLDDPKIYGAGLLSSVGESYHCLGPNVKKIPFTVDCIETTYDITKPQPQLFVVKDFPRLSEELEKLGDKMAFRRGGVEGLEKARQAAATVTVLLESGIEMSGTLVEFRTHAGQPSYVQFKGPSQLGFEEKELAGHGPAHHREGFGSPVGRVAKLGKPAWQLTEQELKALGFEPGKKGRIEFGSGVTVEGELKSRLERDGRTLILTFEGCTVRQGSDFLFRPEWGTFDMACGEKVVSVYGGAADRRAYLAATGGFRQSPGLQKSNLLESERGLETLYARVRKIREAGRSEVEELGEIHEKLEREHPWDWLLRYEILEILVKTGTRTGWENRLRTKLSEIAKLSRDRAEMIGRALEAL